MRHGLQYAPWEDMIGECGVLSCDSLFAIALHRGFNFRPLLSSQDFPPRYRLSVGRLLSVLLFASLLLFGGVRMPFYYCCSTVMVVILFSLGLKRGLFRPKFCLSMALGALVLTFLAVLFARYNYSVGSTDSASYVQTGLRFFTGAPVDVGQTFSSVGTWLSLAHGPVALWGDEYYYLLHPLLFTSLCALFFCSF